MVLQKEIPNIDPDLISRFPLQVLEFLYQIHNMSLDGKISPVDQAAFQWTCKVLLVSRKMTSLETTNLLFTSS